MAMLCVGWISQLFMNAFVGPWDDRVTHRNPFLLMYDIGLLPANTVILSIYYCYALCLSNKILTVASLQVIFTCVRKIRWVGEGLEGRGPPREGCDLFFQNEDGNHTVGVKVLTINWVLFVNEGTKLRFKKKKTKQNKNPRKPKWTWVPLRKKKKKKELSSGTNTISLLRV